MTAIIFDTNLSHSGLRAAQDQYDNARRAGARSVITINFVPAHANAPIFNPLVTPPKTGNSYLDFVLGEARTPDVETFAKANAERIRHQLIATKLVKTEHDFNADELNKLVSRDKRMPTISDIKPRSSPEWNKTIWIDLQGDIDLDLHPGQADNERDIQLVAIRDAGTNLTILHHIIGFIAATKHTTLQPLSIAFLLRLSERLAVLSTHRTQSLRRCGIFARDLMASLKRLDSPQRVRTTMLHLLITAIHSAQEAHRLGERGAIDSTEQQLLAACYASYVQADDAVHVQRRDLDAQALDEWQKTVSRAFMP